MMMLLSLLFASAPCKAGPVDVSALRRSPYFVASAHGFTVRWATAGAAPSALVLNREGHASQTLAAHATDLPARTTHLDHDETQFEVMAADLAPATAYCSYVVVAGKIASTPTWIHTAPDRAAHFSVLVLGDSGTNSPEQHAVLARAAADPVDLILHTGDIAYDDGTYAQFEANVFAVYADLFRQTPFFPSPGNHDYRTDKGAPYLTLFARPSPAVYYSFDWGQAHFVALDTNTIDAAQSAWLAKDLAASHALFKIVYFHTPAYSSGPHGDSLEVQKSFVPIFDAASVDLVLAGHDHDYERFAAMRGGQPSTPGTVYVTSGGGGAALYERKAARAGSVAWASAHHFVRLAIDGCGLSLEAIDVAGKVIDHARIDKCVR